MHDVKKTSTHKTHNQIELAPFGDAPIKFTRNALAQVFRCNDKKVRSDYGLTGCAGVKEMPLCRRKERVNIIPVILFDMLTFGESSFRLDSQHPAFRIVI